MDYKKKILHNEVKRLISLGHAGSLNKIAAIHKNDPLNLQIVDELGTYLYRKLASRGTESEFPKATDELNQLLRAAFIKRNRILLLGNYLAVKFPDLKDLRDENVHEAAVGLQVNTIRKVLPNFVWTYGIIKCHPTSAMKDYSAKESYKCCITEKVNGVSFSLWGRRKSFRERFLIYVQLWLALAYANREIGFTHNDLHMGNAIIINLSDAITIDYEQTTIVTSELVKIIDFGRSFSYSTDGTKTILGRPIPGQSIKLEPNYWYDAYFILRQSVHDEEKNDPEVKRFINFFGIHQTGKLYDDMRQIVQKKYDFNKWLDLIFNCPSGKALLKRKQLTSAAHVSGEKQLAVVKSVERIPLPPDFHFENLRQYLAVHDYKDTPLVQTQIAKNELRIKRLITIRDNLKSRELLPTDLKILNPEDYPESKQEQIVTYLEEIGNISNTIYLKKHLNFAVEKYRQRLDFLFHWMTL